MRRNARNSGWASIERLSDRTTGASAGAGAGRRRFYRGLPTQPVARHRRRTSVFRRGTLQRITVAVIKVADLVKSEAHLIDLEIGAEQRGRRHFLDGETESFGGGIESLGGHAAAAAARIALGVELHLLAFTQAADAGALQRGGVDENVLLAVVRLNEAEAFLIIVEFNGTRSHGKSLH